MSTTHAADMTDLDACRRADRLLLSVARGGGMWVGVLALTALAMAAAELAFPTVIGRAVDAALDGRSAAVWVVSCAALIAVLVTSSALAALCRSRRTKR